MNIIERSGHSYLELDGPWSGEARSLISTGAVDGLVLNYAKGFFAEDLAFLRGLPLRSLTILARWIEDLSPVESLGGVLEELSLTASPAAKVDLGKLPKLSTLSSDWSHVSRSWDSLAPTVETVILADCPARSLGWLGLGLATRSLTLVGNSALESLGGIEAMPGLGHLAVANARRLLDISALESPSAVSLEDLRLENCRGFTSVDALSGLTNLRRLNVANCGPIQSAGPLRGLTRLEKLHAWESTNFLDGDLSPIAGLPRLAELRIKARRHYRPPVAELQQLIAGRNSSAGVKPEGA